MNGLFYTKRHEWIRLNGQKLFVGLTGKSLNGDVVYIELPGVGQNVGKGQPCAKVESVKAAMEVYSPVAGRIIAINDTVYDDPDVITTQPQSTWLFCVEFEGAADTDGLLTESEYMAI